MAGVELTLRSPVLQMGVPVGLFIAPRLNGHQDKIDSDGMKRSPAASPIASYYGVTVTVIVFDVTVIRFSGSPAVLRETRME